MTIPTTMRALVQTSLDGPRGLSLVGDAPVPRPRVGEVLVRVAAAGINFVDVARARGTFGDNPQPPFVAGFEAAGEVVAVGDAVASPRVGAIVIGAGPGAFAEYTVLPAAGVMPVPTGWTGAQALGLAINWPTALAALHLGRLVEGETVLIHAAAGATGQAAVIAAKHRGARVIAAASRSKHDAIRADHVLDARAPELAGKVLELTGGRGADLVLESGGSATFHASLAATKRVTGRMIVLGTAGGDASVSNHDLVYRDPIQLIGFNLGMLIRSAPDVFGAVMGQLFDLVGRGVVQPGRPTSHPFADGAKVLAALADRATTGKLALVP